MSLKSLYRSFFSVRFRRTVSWLRFPKAQVRRKMFSQLIAPVRKGEVQVSTRDLRGTYWVDVRSHLFRRIATEGCYEPTVAHYLDANVVGDFLDVGANVGFYAIHLALKREWDGRCIAIDPNPRAIEFLKRNIVDNEVTSITPIQIAADDRCAELDLLAFDGREEYSTLSGDIHPSVRGAESRKYRVESRPIDDVLKEYPDFSPGLVKIDAEGAELRVLNGMKGTITKYRPLIVCEVGAATFGSDVVAITDLLSSLGYGTYNFEGFPCDIDPSSSTEIVAKPID